MGVQCSAAHVTVLSVSHLLNLYHETKHSSVLMNNISVFIFWLHSCHHVNLSDHWSAVLECLLVAIHAYTLLVTINTFVGRLAYKYRGIIMSCNVHVLANSSGL